MAPCEPNCHDIPNPSKEVRPTTLAKILGWGMQSEPDGMSHPSWFRWGYKVLIPTRICATLGFWKAFWIRFQRLEDDFNGPWRLDHRYAARIQGLDF